MKIAAIILAAGQSRRMGFNKLLADVSGKPLIVRTVENIAASKVQQVFVVTGHQAGEVATALVGFNVTLIHNSDFASGIASSIKAGIAGLNGFDGALICLGDMPLVSSAIVDEMIAAFDPEQKRELVLPVRKGALGNPVLWDGAYFPELLKLEGDRGARGLIEKYRAHATEIEIGDDSVALDADTPEALAQIKSIAGF
jgi:molybdenum cofactor cytidylyltransferase